MSTTQESLTKLARECGATTYTNRHFPLATAFSFSPLSWERFCEALAAQHEPFTEWLTCPKCSHKSPYSPIKAKTLAEDAERITKQARAALGQHKPWQGLTLEDKQRVLANDFGGNRLDCMDEAEKILREKNA